MNYWLHNFKNKICTSTLLTANTAMQTIDISCEKTSVGDILKVIDLVAKVIIVQ